MIKCNSQLAVKLALVRTLKHAALCFLIGFLSACCAPGATQSAQETAFRATVLDLSEQEITVTLSSGERLELEPSPLLTNVKPGEQIYVTGVLNVWGSVDVSDIRKL